MRAQRPVPLCVAATVALLATVVVQHGPLTAQSSYRLVDDWPHLPDDFEWGQLPNVTIDHDGNIYAFHCAEPPVLEFSPEGALLNTWGAGMMVRAHGFRIAPDGNIFATDQRGHRVYKFSTAGALLLALGETGVPGPDLYSPRAAGGRPVGALLLFDTFYHAEEHLPYPTTLGSYPPGERQWHSTPSTAPATRTRTRTISTLTL